jgi:hypothetical protein
MDTHPVATVIPRFGHKNHRLSPTLIKAGHEELTLRDVKNGDRPGYVNENTSDDDKMSSEKSDIYSKVTRFIQKNAGLWREFGGPIGLIAGFALHHPSIFDVASASIARRGHINTPMSIGGHRKPYAALPPPGYRTIEISGKVGYRISSTKFAVLISGK